MLCSPWYSKSLSIWDAVFGQGKATDHRDSSGNALNVMLNLAYLWLQSSSWVSSSSEVGPQALSTGLGYLEYLT